MNVDKNILKKCFSRIPEELQDIAVSEKTAERIKSVSKNFGLSQTQSDNLEILSMYVLLGIEKGEDFTNKIKNLGIQDDSAKKIASEIDKSVFWPIRDLLPLARNAYQEVLRGVNQGTMSSSDTKTIASVLFKQK